MHLFAVDAGSRIGHFAAQDHFVAGRACEANLQATSSSLGKVAWVWLSSSWM
jgi:hypothetical protein